MKASKKKKLTAQGWRIGSAGELLDLTPEEEKLIEMKLALAESLRKERRKGRMTQVQLAALLGSSQSRVAKMEAADATVSMDLLVRGLLALGVSPGRIARILGTGIDRSAA